MNDWKPATWQDYKEMAPYVALPVAIWVLFFWWLFS